MHNFVKIKYILPPETADEIRDILMTAATRKRDFRPHHCELLTKAGLCPEAIMTFFRECNDPLVASLVIQLVVDGGRTHYFDKASPTTQEKIREIAERFLVAEAGYDD